MKGQSEHLRLINYTNNQLPLFDTIGIETSEYCNRTCSFCPNSIHKQQRRLMPGELYFKIIDELQVLNYQGTICFHQYNEPLFDKRLEQFVLHARNKLPRSTLMFSSNGDALTIKRWDLLRKNGLNFAVVSQYDGYVTDKMKSLIDYVKNEDILKVEIRGEFNLESTRCGTVNPSYNIDLPLDEGCLRPFSQLIVRFDGKIALCCEDYFIQELIGDVGQEKLQDIWYGDKLNKIRDSLIQDKRRGICKKCNTSLSYSIESCDWIGRQRLI